MQWHGQNWGHWGEIPAELCLPWNGNSVNQDWFEVVIPRHSLFIPAPEAVSLTGSLLGGASGLLLPGLSIHHPGHRQVHALAPYKVTQNIQKSLAGLQEHTWACGTEARAQGSSQDPTSPGVIPIKFSSSQGNSLMALPPACRWSLISCKIICLLLYGSIAWIALLAACSSSLNAFIPSAASDINVLVWRESCLQELLLRISQGVSQDGLGWKGLRDQLISALPWTGTPSTTPELHPTWPWAPAFHSHLNCYAKSSKMSSPH